MVGTEVPAGSPRFLVLTPDGPRREAPITTSPFRIGRRPSSDLFLDHKTISKEHASVLLVNGRYYLKDHSKHGVFVNGEQIEVRTLEPNDVIKLGLAPYQLIFTNQSPQSDLALLLDSLAGESRTGNVRRLGAVLDVARALETQSLEEVLGAVVAAALKATGAERGFLLLQTPPAEEWKVQVARDSRGRHLHKDDLQTPIRDIQSIARSGRGLLPRSIDAGPQASEITVDDLDALSWACVPLLRMRLAVTDSSDRPLSEDVLGALYLDSRLPTGMPTGDQDLLLALAAEASAALENARLWSEARQSRRLHHELSIASAIQSALLRARLPADGWLRAAASSQPCFQVGGDYYDLIQCSSADWSAVVADVAGKGLAAALLASLLQGAFSTAAMFTSAGYQAGLDEILAFVNRYVFERSLATDFATIFYCALRSDGVLRWASAGHCPALLVRPGGEVVSLGATGLPLGAFPDSCFTEERFSLLPGDKLIVYSDGVTEAEDAARRQFGHTCLEQLAREHCHESAAQLHRSILDAVAAFTAGMPQSDDLTVLVLEYAGEGSAKMTA